MAKKLFLQSNFTTANNLLLSLKPFQIAEKCFEDFTLSFR